MDLNGVVLYHIQEGHFNTRQFTSFLADLFRHRVLSTIGGANSVVVLDGCNIHKSNNISKAFRLSGVRYVILPPYSPECNPIEAFFGVRRKVREFSLFHLSTSQLQLLQLVLRNHMNFDCREIFAHSSWRHFRTYKSPYLHGPQSEQWQSF
ncbi:hypothetical protein P9112_009981 [Eukaryota sp. TZLM1-RC]